MLNQEGKTIKAIRTKHWLFEHWKRGHTRFYYLFFEPHLDYIRIEIAIGKYSVVIAWWKEAKEIKNV